MDTLFLVERTFHKVADLTTEIKDRLWGIRTDVKDAPTENAAVVDPREKNVGLFDAIDTQRRA